MDSKVYQFPATGNISKPAGSQELTKLIRNNPEWLAKSEASNSFIESTAELPSELGCKNLGG